MNKTPGNICGRQTAIVENVLKNLLINIFYCVILLNGKNTHLAGLAGGCLRVSCRADCRGGIKR